MHRFGCGLEAVGRDPQHTIRFSASCIYLARLNSRNGVISIQARFHLVRAIVITIGISVSTLIYLKVVLRLRFVRLATVTDVFG